MAAITDLSDLVNRMTGGNSGTPENLWFHKQARAGGAAATAPIAGRVASLWTYEGFPGAGSAPGGTARIPDNTTNGGLVQADPGGGREKWLISAFATGIVGGTLILYDRLMDISGLSGTTTTAQNVGGTITRYTDGVGNIAWIEIYTIIGTTGTTVTMQYDGTTGGANQTGSAVTIGGTGFREVTRCIMLPTAAGETGITNVDNIDLLASTTTAGDIGVTLGHPLAYLDLSAAGQAGFRCWTTGLPGIPEIQTDACLAWLWVPITTTVPEIFGCLSMVEA